MVYLAELLVVMTDWLEIEFLLEMYSVHGNEHVDDDDEFLTSLSRFTTATLLCSRCAGAPSC